MPAVEEIVDKFSGMITKRQAAAILDDAIGEEVHEDFADVAALLEFANAERSGKTTAQTYYINVQDSLYRVFNATQLGGKQPAKRRIVLGKDGSTIVMSLRLQAGSIDTGAFERGDVVAIDNGILDIEKGELIDCNSTRIRRITEGGVGTITDYGALDGGLKSINVIGKVIGLGEIRQVGMLNSSGKAAVLDCTLTDFNKVVGATLWGSSALAAARMKVNDYVKIEFCSAVVKENGITIHANDSSRIVVSDSFGKRLKAGR